MIMLLFVIRYILLTGMQQAVNTTHDYHAKSKANKKDTYV